MGSRRAHERMPTIHIGYCEVVEDPPAYPTRDVHSWTERTPQYATTGYMQAEASQAPSRNVQQNPVTRRLVSTGYGNSAFGGAARYEEPSHNSIHSGYGGMPEVGIGYCEVVEDPPAYPTRDVVIQIRKAPQYATTGYMQAEASQAPSRNVKQNHVKAPSRNAKQNHVKAPSRNAKKKHVSRRRVSSWASDSSSSESSDSSSSEFSDSASSESSDSGSDGVDGFKEPSNNSIYRAFGGYQNFMLSYNLKMRKLEDVEEGHQILAGIKENMRQEYLDSQVRRARTSSKTNRRSKTSAKTYHRSKTSAKTNHRSKTSTKTNRR